MSAEESPKSATEQFSQIGEKSLRMGEALLALFKGDLNGARVRKSKGAKVGLKPDAIRGHYVPNPEATNRFVDSLVKCLGNDDPSGSKSDR